jgi:hypothetical protein
MTYIRTTKTTKLFWKKFPYRVTVFAPWIGFLHHFNIEPSRYAKEVSVFNNLIKIFDKDDIKVRIENQTANIFLKREDFIDKIINTFPNNITEVSKPENDKILEFLTSNIATEIKNELPYGCRYRVFVGYNKMTSQTARENFVALANRIPNDVKVTPVVINKLAVDRPWYSQYYFYVKDDKHLMMVQLLLNHNIKKIIQIKTNQEIKEEQEINA